MAVAVEPPLLLLLLLWLPSAAVVAAASEERVEEREGVAVPQLGDSEWGEQGSAVRAKDTLRPSRRGTS